MFDLFAGHEVVRELKAMSAWLDHDREPASLVAADLRRDGEGDEAGLPGAGRAAPCSSSTAG
jgi:IS5 family transposase